MQVSVLKNRTQRISLVAIGHIVKRVEEFLFDWLLYGVVVLFCTTTWGSVWGSLIAFSIMAPLSAYFSLLWIAYYNWSKRDWFGLEFLKELRDETKRGWFAQRIQAGLKRGGVPAFFILSFYTDPFMTVVYFRKKGESYTLLGPRDTNIFWCSVVVSNAYWTLRWTVLVEAALFLWRYKQSIIG